MKKYFALIISLIVILTCFTACKPKIKNGTVVENGVGEQIAIVTSPDGGIVRDDAGNLVVLVTDENGRNVKDDNGEYKTNAVAMDHAIVIGRRVETRNYSVEIPNGWSDAKTLNDLQITKDGTDESLVITEKDGSVSQAIEELAPIFENAKSMYANVISENTSVEINEDITASFMSVYIPEIKTDENGNPVPGYLAYFFFEEAGHTYTCKIEGRRNISENLGEFTEILSSINFR
ncbi:MAG: hypothetical protein IJZ07_04100 [Clostridia bacterium]|nr:hypothetical protein [Clostridia bacterium]